MAFIVSCQSNYEQVSFDKFKDDAEGIYSKQELTAYNNSSYPHTDYDGYFLYKQGNFPNGKFMTLSELSKLPDGKMEVPTYYIGTINLADDPIHLPSGGFIFKAYESYFWGSMVNSANSMNVVFIYVPYSVPAHAGMSLDFDDRDPLAVIEKITTANDSGDNYNVYFCMYQGFYDYMGVRYPKIQ